MEFQNRLAAFVVLAFSVFTAILGGVALVVPGAFDTAIRTSLEVPAILYVSAVIRILIGITIYLAASVSRAPRTLRVVAVFFVVAGVSLPFIGIQRVRELASRCVASARSEFGARRTLTAIVIRRCR